MRKYRSVIILTVVLIALIGVYYYTINRKPIEEIEEPSETITIFETDKDNIAEISISTDEGSFAFYNEDGEWKTRAEGDINFEQSKVDSLAYDVATINADELVEENASDLTTYGLQTPKGTVKVILNDGEIKTFYVGDKTPTATGYYFQELGDNTVYTIYSYKGETFTGNLDDYRTRELFSLNPEDIISVEIQGQDREHLLVQVKQEVNEENPNSMSGWNVIHPFKRDGDNEKIGELILEKLQSLTIKDFIDDMPSDLGKYGLNPAKHFITITDNDSNEVNFSLGNNKDNESIYIKMADGNSVYTVNTDSVKFKDVDAFTLIEKFAYIVNIDTVDKFVINHNDKYSTFEIIRSGEGEEKTSEYKVNGKDADESLFKKFYQEVIGLTVNKVYSKEVTGTPEVSYTFHHNNGTPKVKVEFISVDDRNYAVVKNGVCEFTIGKKYVNAMLEALEKFENNPMEKEE